MNITSYNIYAIRQRKGSYEEHQCNVMTYSVVMTNLEHETRILRRKRFRETHASGQRSLEAGLRQPLGPKFALLSIHAHIRQKARTITCLDEVTRHHNDTVVCIGFYK